MPNRKPLSAEEEKRCVDFLHALGVKSPDHQILSDRGYFGIFLTGLTPEEIPTDTHPSIREFKESVRLLAFAGIERLRDLLHEASLLELNNQAAELERPEQAPKPPTSPLRRVEELRKGDRKIHHASFKRDIHVIPPDEAARRRLETLGHAETIAQAQLIAQRHCELHEYHDAYHILFDYLARHALDEEVLKSATQVILMASRFDRDKGEPPFNMLYECEEMAALLAKRIPDIFTLNESGDERTAHLYRCVKVVYTTWTYHCRALLEYKYRTSSKTWMQRSWIDPQDFGFLHDVMLIGVRSRLPLDLLRYILVELMRCVEIGKQVIAHDDKRAKFEGDILRIIASPTRDVIPDLCFEIYGMIVDAYKREGDTATAMTFCRQALLIRRTDRQMLKILEELKQKGTSGGRDPMTRRR